MLLQIPTRASGKSGSPPVDGGPARQVSNTPQGGAIAPAWSPDGRQITFNTGRYESDIWIASSSGAHARSFPHPADDTFPEFSPSGRWLTFGSNRSGGDRLWRMPAGGGDASPVTPEHHGPLVFHRYSPDGSHIYFVGMGDRAGTIWQISADGTGERQATDLSGRRGYLEPLSLATDGRDLYFTWGEDLGDIWVMDVVRP